MKINAHRQFWWGGGGVRDVCLLLNTSCQQSHSLSWQMWNIFIFYFYLC